MVLPSALSERLAGLMILFSCSSVLTMCCFL